MSTLISSSAAALVAFVPGLVFKIEDPAALFAFGTIAVCLQLAAWELIRTSRRNASSTASCARKHA